MGVESYRDLVVWNEGMALALSIYRATAEFPKQELYGLVSQMRRCSVSIPSNIAEGHARSSTLEYLRHVSIAAGSPAELETQLLLSKELNYLSAADVANLLLACDVLGKRLHKMTASLRSRARRIKDM
jgi:four helix bundle protein